MNIGAARQFVVGNLDHWANHHQRPIGAQVGNLRKQGDIEPLVDDAIEAKSRMRQLRLVGRIGLGRAGAHEMLAIDRRREAVHAVVAVLLGFEQARSAGEDEVGTIDQLLFERQQKIGREAEHGKLVHHVKHHDIGIEIARKRKHQRGIIPSDDRTTERRCEGVEQAGQRRLGLGHGQASGQMWNDHTHRREAFDRPDFEMRGFAAAEHHRLLPIDHVHVAGEAGHQLLRALKHEIPTQVRKAQQGRTFQRKSGRLRERVSWR